MQGPRLVGHGPTLFAGLSKRVDDYPSAAPEHQQEWDDVVRLFLDGTRAAVVLAESPERLALEVEPGVTMADELHSLAVHNAYHLGKIVSLRQMIGAWPPKARPL